MKISNLALTIDNPPSKGPCVQKWSTSDSKIASYSKGATVALFGHKTGIFTLKIRKSAIPIDDQYYKGPSVQKWSNSDSKIASYSQGATVAIFEAQNRQFGDFLNENLQSGINHR